MTPKIFIWICGGWELGDVVGAAIAEDGESLASHLSSSLSWLHHDMGLIGSTWKHDTYKAKYPDGYELVWVEDPATHTEFQAAYAKHIEMYKETT